MRYFRGYLREDFPAGFAVFVLLQAIDQARCQGVKFDKPYLVLPVPVDEQADRPCRFCFGQEIRTDAMYRVFIGQGPGQFVQYRNA